MISMIVKLGHANIGLPAYLYPVLPVALISAAAYLVASRLEPYVRKLIVGLLPNTRFNEAT